MTTPTACDAVAAAADNARWCDLVCRSAALPTATDDARWWTARRTPPGYPDAVTLRPGVPASAVLDGIDAGPGASVKDSFADLDLRPAGFEVLFDATWLGSSLPGSAAHARTRLDWSDAPDDEEADVLPELVPGTPGARALVGRDGDGVVAASLVLTGEPGDRAWPGAADVVGAAHVVTRRGDPRTVWHDLPAVVARLVPDARCVVGYERGPDLAAAVAAGFTTAGPLRVWVRPG